MIASVDAARDRTWDAIVIGTGMGGSTAGYALARAGRSVLFIERGFAQSGQSLTGCYPEDRFDDETQTDERHRSMLAHAGREWRPVEDVSGNRRGHFVPFVGAGAGGSSALYGMALERFFPADLAPRRYFGNAPLTTLPEHWPIGYEDLLPYYADAEVLFGVRGTRDPLRPFAPPLPLEPPPLTAAGEEMFELWRGRGLHPYRLPSACAFVAGCTSCQGFLCPRACKHDGGQVCLGPATRDHGAMMLDQCEVDRLQATDHSVTAIECVRYGERFLIRGRIVLLAAGALMTPAVLLRSASPNWPDGLANRSGLVGRNLMRHFVDLYAVQPHTRAPFDNRRKEMSFSDFYLHDGVKLGSVQSFGRLPSKAVIAAELAADIARSRARWAAPAVRWAKPLIARSLKPIIERRLILASIVEDLPYADNRVTLTPANGIRLNYALHAEAVRRVDRQRKLVTNAVRPLPMRLIRQAENNERIAHVCGTCRFGEDSRSSVLDRDNRAHDVDNLYIVDSSFFPSSAGTNPALTIAANALRVADRILATSNSSVTWK